MRTSTRTLGLSAPRRLDLRYLRRLIAYLIVLYQHHLSPRKGYRCARRALHGGLSCSEYVRQAVLHHDLLDAARLTRMRFADCYAAGRVTAHKRAGGEGGGEGKEPPREGDAAEIGQKCFLLPTSMCCISGFMFK